jgi:DNA-binding NarL/FixJ family response regulator
MAELAPVTEEQINELRQMLDASHDTYEDRDFRRSALDQAIKVASMGQTHKDPGTVLEVAKVFYEFINAKD